MLIPLSWRCFASALPNWRYFGI